MTKSAKNDDRNAFQKAGPYLNIGYTLFGSVLLFAYIGYLVDDWSGKKPLFLIIGVFLGLFGGFYNMIKVLQQLSRK